METLIRYCDEFNSECAFLCGYGQLFWARKIDNETLVNEWSVKIISGSPERHFTEIKNNAGIVVAFVGTVEQGIAYIIDGLCYVTDVGTWKVYEL